MQANEDDPRFDGDPRITCSDNVAKHLNRVDYLVVQGIPVAMIRKLLKQRMFDRTRILNAWYPLVVDGTVQELCREGFGEDGKSGGKAGKRYRYVLQCCLLGPSNRLFPLLHEHADIHDPATEKEDCEIKAFYRLAKRLKRRFPGMPFCIMADSLYCASTIADLCEQHHWKYVVTLKEGRQPCLWDEALQLLPFSASNVVRVLTGQDGKEGVRDFRWVADLTLGRNPCTVVFFGEITDAEATLYVYATNFLVTRDRVLQIIPATGRERHHIEDYFNTGKNNGIGLGHVFCVSQNASKNFFTLMQIAWILWTIICHGCLKRLFRWAALATDRALAGALGEGLRAYPLTQTPLMFGQVRFVTS